MTLASRSAFFVVAILLLAPTPTVPAGGPALPQEYVRLAPGPRYLKIVSKTFANHEVYAETEIDDLDTGRFVRYDTDRLGTNSTGFDGRVSWTADETGLPLVDDTPDGIGSALMYAHLGGRSGPENVRVTALTAIGGRTRLRVRYPGVSGPIDITLGLHSPFIASIDDFVGATSSVSTFSDYREVGHVMVPFRSGSSSEFGSLRNVVIHADAVSSVKRAIFSPPAAPRDAQLQGVTAVSFAVKSGYAIMVPIRIDDGPVIRVAFDSGASNYLSPKTARRLGLPVVGLGKSGGVGAGLVDEQYTRVPAVEIGKARILGMPFSILDDGSTNDGTIGCEVLQRFAVQFDFQHRVVRLSRDARALKNRGMPLPIQTGNCQPQVASVLDGLSGISSIDTGSGVAADIMSPFVMRHHLFARYNARDEYSGGGIGGETSSLLGRGGSLRIGPFHIADLDVMLSEMRKGAFSDPTTMANLGLPLLSRFTLTLDYRSHRMWLAQRRPLRHVPHFLN